MIGWTCPKCNRIYAPNVYECYECNSVIELEADEKQLKDIYGRAVIYRNTLQNDDK